MYLGLALLSAGKTVEGESSLRQSLEIQPTLLEARAALAQVEAARGNRK
jgi:Tfp pilus assembly protein PilF